MERQLVQYNRDVEAVDGPDNPNVSNMKYVAYLIRLRCNLAQATRRLLQRYGPELRCLFLYVLERQCLHSKSCATLSESIYGVKRVKLLASGKLVALTGTEKTRLTLCLALGPYLREKGELLDRRLRHYHALRGPSNWRRKFVAIYSFLRMIFDGAGVLCQWRYLLGRSVFYDPVSMLLQQVVRRVTQEDMGGIPSELTPGSEDAPPNSILPTKGVDQEKYRSVGRKVAAYLLTTSFMLSWATQIRSEWQRHSLDSLYSERSGSTLIGGYAIPPPPSPVSSSCENTPEGLCPLCRRSRIQPTASTSGHVFCLSCLLPFVKEYARCPITGVDCQESQVVRLYEPAEVHNES
jgi:hypothetical protein